jgi:5,10-methylenetetrahydromethanopterin reductase
MTMKVSVCMIPAGPLDGLLDAIDAADQLGLHGLYTVDEPWWRGAYEMLTIAALRTRRVRGDQPGLRLGPDVTHLMREPVFVAQSLATLDELSGGRVEAALSTGSLDLVAQLGRHLDHPIGRLREAHAIIRQLLDTGALDRFDGTFYNIHNMFLTTRAIQDHLPVMLGGMRGPRSFRLAGEVSDGLHHAGAYKLGALQYAADEFRAGAKRAGRDPKSLDLAAWVGGIISESSEEARRASLYMTAFYLPATPAEQLERHGIDPDRVKPVLDAVNARDIAGAARLVPPDIAAAQSVSGTPEEAAEQIAEEFAPAGFTHLVFGLVSGDTVKALTGTDPGGIPSVAEQIELIARRLIPRLPG